MIFIILMDSARSESEHGRVQERNEFVCDLVKIKLTRYIQDQWLYC